MRLGHMSEKCMTELHGKNLFKGLKACHLNFYKYCVHGNQGKIQFRSLTSYTSSFVLNHVDTNVWRLASVKAHGSTTNFITSINDFFKKVWAYFMKHKDKAFSMFKQWKVEMKTQTRKKLKYLMSNNRCEYKSKEFIDLCQ